MKDKKTINILLVEDDDLDVMLVERGFRKINCDCHIVRARDGLEGIDMLREEGRIPTPHVIMLDLNMPRMNGLEFLENLRKDDLLKNKVVFVFTTSKAEEDIWGAYQKNVAGYLLKEKGETEINRAIKLLDTYFNIVELPSGHSGLKKVS